MDPRGPGRDGPTDVDALARSIGLGSGRTRGRRDAPPGLPPTSSTPPEPDRGDDAPGDLEAEPNPLDSYGSAVLGIVLLLAIVAWIGPKVREAYFTDPPAPAPVANLREQQDTASSLRTDLTAPDQVLRPDKVQRGIAALSDLIGPDERVVRVTVGGEGGIEAIVVQGRRAVRRFSTGAGYSAPATSDELAATPLTMGAVDASAPLRIVTSAGRQSPVYARTVSSITLTADGPGGKPGWRAVWGAPDRKALYFDAGGRLRRPAS